MRENSLNIGEQDIYKAVHKVSIGEQPEADYYFLFQPRDYHSYLKGISVL